MRRITVHLSKRSIIVKNQLQVENFLNCYPFYNMARDGHHVRMNLAGEMVFFDTIETYTVSDDKIMLDASGARNTEIDSDGFGHRGRRKRRKRFRKKYLKRGPREGFRRKYQETRI